MLHHSERVGIFFTMNRVRRKKNTDFTTISNTFLKDRELSIKAKGLLAVIMGLPDDWDFSINGLVAITKEGKGCIYSTINELKERGYCKVESLRDEKGKIAGNDYLFIEEPNTENPYTENPYTENPYMGKQDMGNRTQLNKQLIKETKNKRNNNVSDLSFVDADLMQAFTLWLQYKKEKGQTYKSESTIKVCYNKLMKMANQSTQIAKQIIEQSIANNYAGLFPLKNTNNNGNTRINNAEENRKFLEHLDEIVHAGYNMEDL